MADRPILFSAPMVRALLEGRKTQTRRVFVPPKPFAVGDDIEIQIATGEFKPRIAAGDRLWVREAWAPLDALKHSDPGVQGLIDRGFYRADDSTVEGEISKWRPSIHMPRWASRLTLTVTDVRVQRLQEVSETDAKAEGVGDPYLGDGDPPFEECAIMISCWRQFRNLWGMINGFRSWDENPWVAAYTFSVIKTNIDREAA